MKKISLDANAVLDFCYRFYGNLIFKSLWENLTACVRSKQICFFIVESIRIEVDSYIDSHGLDRSIFNQFVDDFGIRFPENDNFGDQTLELKQYLLQYPSCSKIHHVTKDNYGDIDIISLAKFNGKDSIVLTSETESKKLNWNASKISSHDVKIPNLCKLFNVDCYNWYKLFEYLGHKY